MCAGFGELRSARAMQAGWRRTSVACVVARRRHWQLERGGRAASRCTAAVRRSRLSRADRAGGKRGLSAASGQAAWAGPEPWRSWTTLAGPEHTSRGQGHRVRHAEGLRLPERHRLSWRRQGPVHSRAHALATGLPWPCNQRSKADAFKQDLASAGSARGAGRYLWLRVAQRACTSGLQKHREGALAV